mgnify:FL=1
MKDLPSYYGSLIDLIETYISHRVDYWTLQSYGGNYGECGPYVQALMEYDNMILIEAVSNVFLDPPLSEQDHQKMLFMGWRFIGGPDYPNYTQLIDLGKRSAREIASIMARALYFAYGVDDNFAFNISPHPEKALAKKREK